MEEAPDDTLIIGAGIVGAAIAHFLAPHARVRLLEGEAAPGFHTTGRSAALYAPAYGPPQVRALTRASRAFFDAPPPGFASVPLLLPRPSLFVGGPGDAAALQALQTELRSTGVAAELLSADQAQQLVPVLQEQACAVSLLDPSSSDIDVDALLQGFLRSARANGAQLVCSARVTALRHEGGLWQLQLADGRRFSARQVVNAAGAWADEVAALAGTPRVGLEPRRRTAFLFDGPPGANTNAWPAVVAADESWYIKPTGGVLLGSPANADPTHPHDVVAEELDVATGIHRVQEATTLQIRRPRSTWAGLRCFVADGEPVCGFAPGAHGAPGFFWAAALGGYGIQSSPGFGALCAALLRGQGVPAALAAEGLDLAALRPGRPGAQLSAA